MSGRNMTEITYAERLTRTLSRLGYTHCFLVPGGGIMHLVDAARKNMTVVPFVHEVSAGIAAEYFTETSSTNGGDKAYALVTTGPGATNVMTAIAGAYLESRELLVVAGQVKSADLAGGGIRQRGIQEVDGRGMAEPVSKETIQVVEPIVDQQLAGAVCSGAMPRQGPVFVEVCLDAQGAPVDETDIDVSADDNALEPLVLAARDAFPDVHRRLSAAHRPVVLIGGGVTPGAFRGMRDRWARVGLPVMTTWNGFDRVPDDFPHFAGRPNTWGQRSANILLAQADLVLVLGSRLGLQQTGFNWQAWTNGEVIQVDVDGSELTKGHPGTSRGLQADANTILSLIFEQEYTPDQQWLNHIDRVRELVPIIEPANTHGQDFLSPYALVDQLADWMSPGDVLIPASSGSGQFVPMETFRLKEGQRVITNKGLASMGYGLAGAIGAALATPDARVVLVEGDGSFSQNLQELGTVAVQQLDLKIFLLANDGYASIRTTQRNYFGGAYVGCDHASGLGLPDWPSLVRAFGLPVVDVGPDGLSAPQVADLLEAPGPAVFVVSVDPEQTYFPKVTSRVREDGGMESNPIHRMSPELSEEIAAEVFQSWS